MPLADDAVTWPLVVHMLQPANAENETPRLGRSGRRLRLDGGRDNGKAVLRGAEQSAARGLGLAKRLVLRPPVVVRVWRAKGNVVNAAGALAGDRQIGLHSNVQLGVRTSAELVRLAIDNGVA